MATNVIFNEQQHVMGEMPDVFSPQPGTHQVGPDETRVQAMLTKQGRQGLGIIQDREEGVITTSPTPSAVEVRRAGLKEAIRKTAAAAAAVGTLAVGAFAGPGVVHSIDSPDRPPAPGSAEAHHEALARMIESGRGTDPILDQPDEATVRARVAATQDEIAPK